MVRAMDHGRSVAHHQGADLAAGTLHLGGGLERQFDLAAISLFLLGNQRRFVLDPVSVLGADQEQPWVRNTSEDKPQREGWRVGIYSSGSTRAPRAFGFSFAQLERLAGWYRDVYQVTEDSVISTSLPVSYSFTFVAGLFLAAHTGARFHLSKRHSSVFREAKALAKEHDRCIVLGNPVLLSEPPGFSLPENTLIDSGGAPLSTTAVQYYREKVAHLVEGYGLAESGSLTHFDVEGSLDSLGTVGRSMPGVQTWIDRVQGKPTISIRSPAMGVALETDDDTGQVLRTGDLGEIDDCGRLRIIGRFDDHQVSEFWPKDTLDAIGHLLGTNCALVRHPSVDQIEITLHKSIDLHTENRIRRRLQSLMGLRSAQIRISTTKDTLLGNLKIPREKRVG